MVLVTNGLVLALCCGCDGKLSSLHRHMTNHFHTLWQTTYASQQKVISRAQLPRLLLKVNELLFAKVLFEWFGLTLNDEHKRWFALDGKELCGSIQPDHTRGEACVSVLTHESEQIVAQLYHNGTKGSERSTVRWLFSDFRVINRRKLAQGRSAQDMPTE